MSLNADNAAARAEHLLALSAQLTAIIIEETRRIEAREPPLDGAEADEKNRLSNAYRLELARIKQEPALIEGASPLLLQRLRRETEVLHAALAKHEIALNAVKIITEGLVQAMAEEVARQRGGAGGYNTQGVIDAPSQPRPTLIDRSA